MLFSDSIFAAIRRIASPGNFRIVSPVSLSFTSIIVRLDAGSIEKAKLVFEVAKVVLISRMPSSNDF